MIRKKFLYPIKCSITIIVPINADPLNNKHMITIHCDNLSDEFTIILPPQFRLVLKTFPTMMWCIYDIVGRIGTSDFPSIISLTISL